MMCNHCHRSLQVDPDARLPQTQRDRLFASVSRILTYGPRVVVEFVIELAQHVDGTDCALAIATQYNERLKPELLRPAGADRMPAPAFRVVPGGLQLDRARHLDRQADAVLQQGFHDHAERLAVQAAKLRSGDR